MSSLESNGSSESEAVPDSLPFESRKTNPLSSLQSSIEVLEGSVEVSESLLRRTLGTLVHPGELCPLQTVQQLVLLHGICELCWSLIGLEECDPLVKAPVVGKTSDPGMSVKGCPLRVVWV